jgi:hypothetical protein
LCTAVTGSQRLSVRNTCGSSRPVLLRDGTDEILAAVRPGR